MASWARRILAAATIFIALVICWVLFTERMRRRRSLRLAMKLFPEKQRIRSGRRGGFASRLLVGGEGAVHLVLHLGGEGAFGLELGHEGAVLAVEVLEEAAFEGAQILDLDIVE